MIESECDDTNGSLYAERFCWAVTGAIFGGVQQGSYERKLMDCLACDFLTQVNEDEGRNFILSPRPKAGTVTKFITMLEKQNPD